MNMIKKITSFVLAFALLFTSLTQTHVIANQIENAFLEQDSSDFTKESSSMVFLSDPVGADGKLEDNHLVTFMDGKNVLTATSVPDSAPVTGLPSAGKVGKALVGWYTDENYTQEFFAANPVTKDLTVYAKYEDIDTIEDTESFTPSFFSVEDMEKDYTFKISIPSSETLENLQKNVALSADIAGNNVKLKFNLLRTENGKSIYEVSAESGFKLGGSYKIVLSNESYTFIGEDDEGKEYEHETTVRQLNLVIKQGAEQDKLTYNENMAFIKHDEITVFTVNEDNELTIDTFDAPMLLVDENGNQSTPEKKTGSFTYAQANNLIVNQIIAIYADSDPRLDMNADVSFVKVVSINGTMVNFETLDAADAGRIFKLPSNLLIFAQEVDFPSTGTFEIDMKVDENDISTLNAQFQLDTELYEIIKDSIPDQETKNSFIMPTKVSVNDIVTFVNSRQVAVGEEDTVKSLMGVVTQVTLLDEEKGTYTVKFDIKENVEELNESLNSYTTKEIPYSVMEPNLDEEAIIADVKKQVTESGFIDQAAQNMASEAFISEDFFNQLGLDYSELYDENGNQRTTDEILMMAGYAPTPLILPPVIKFSLGESDAAFKDGLKIDLSIELSITVEPGLQDYTRKTLQIDLLTTFTQELAFGFDASGYVLGILVSIIPFSILPPFILVPTNVSMTVVFEVKTYTNATFTATMYSLRESAGLGIKKLKKVTSPVFGSMQQHAMKLSRALGYYDMYLLAKDVGKPNAEELLKNAQQLYAEVQKEYPFDPNDPNDLDFNTVSFDTIVAADINITQSTDILKSINEEPDPDVAKAKTNELIESYNELVAGTESEWMELVKKGLFGPAGLKYQFYVIELVFQASFVISADLLISLKSEITYQYGKRFVFWMEMHYGHFDSGSSEMDLLDERFAYSFSIMGYIGLRIGIELSFRVGFISTALANIGILGEIGLYVKMYGYFVYSYASRRGIGQTQAQINESAMGALFVDMGWYAEIDFQALILEGLEIEGYGKYQARLFDYEDSLMTVGEQYNVYAFNYNLDEGTLVDLVDEVGNDGDISLDMPEILQTMKVLDLKSGELFNDVYSADNFNFISSSEYFEVAPDGRITITMPNDRVRYMEAEIQIVWKGQPLTFSKYPIMMTVPVVWHNLSTEELQVPRTVNVNVIDDLGNNTSVWSDMVYASEMFYLPSEEEILDLISYDAYNITNTLTSEMINLKYEDVIGYTKDDNNIPIDETKGQIILNDTDYFFEIDIRDFSIVIDGIEGSAETSKTLTAKFSETFDLSALESTGLNGPDEYSAFNGINTIRQENQDADREHTVQDDRDFSKAIDISFAKEILDGETSYSAVYANTGAQVTYQFAGLNKESITKTYEVGSVPNFYSDIGLDPSSLTVTDSEGVVHFYQGVSPNVSVVHSDTVYTVSYSANTPEATTYNVDYYVDDNTTAYKTVKFIENTEIFPIPNPEKTGFTFVGWCTDEALTQDFTGFDPITPHKMIADLSLYAKFEKAEYTVKFESELTGVANPENMTVAYGDAYSTATNADNTANGLPSLTNATKYFEGWYTESVGGVKVEDTTTHNTEGEVTLYGRWSDKITFKVTSLGNPAGAALGTTTDGDAKAAFTYHPNPTDPPRAIFVFKAVENSVERDLTAEELAMISTEYQWQRDQGEPGNSEWFKEAPTDAGVYYAKTVYDSGYDADNSINSKYNDLSRDFGAGILTIHRATLDISKIENLTTVFTPLIFGANIHIVEPASVTIDGTVWPGVEFGYQIGRVYGGNIPLTFTGVTQFPYEGSNNTQYHMKAQIKLSRNYNAGGTAVQFTPDNAPIRTDYTPDYWDIYAHISGFHPLSGTFSENNISVGTLAGDEIQTQNNGMFMHVSTAANALPPVSDLRDSVSGVDTTAGYANNDFDVNGKFIESSFVISPWEIKSFSVGVLNDGGMDSDNFTGRFKLVVDYNDPLNYNDTYPNISIKDENIAEIPLRTNDPVLRVDDDDDGAFPRYHSMEYNSLIKLKRTVETYHLFTVTDTDSTYKAVFDTYKDQYGVYNPLAQPSSPTVKITATVDGYARFMETSKVALPSSQEANKLSEDTLQFTADKNAILEQLEKDGLDRVDIKITLTFPVDSTNNLNHQSTEYSQTLSLIRY